MAEEVRRATARSAARSLTQDEAKAVYRAAIDPRASDFEGEAWWASVHAEMNQVLEERSASAAAKHISWWHFDWGCVSDTALAAAQRIRAAARSAGVVVSVSRC